MDGRPRVLVVDDELGVRESLRAILEGDYDVRLASSGDEALGVLGREPVDVVTVDLRMPGLGGLAVLERIKQRDPDIEVLIITGNGCFESARQGLRQHAFDYLTKPFDAEHVRRVVQGAVDRRAAVRRLKAGPESLLAELSHEFRTPLNVIVGYSSMLREEGASALTQEQQLALDRIQANSGTLLGYVETLFYLAELDRGLVPLTTTPVRVAAVLARIRDELLSRARAKGLLVAVDAPADLVVATDENKLVRLLRALVDNAVRYTQLGRVALIGRPAPVGVTLEVRDTGPGMPREVAADLERAAHSSAAASASSGFGLRLVRRLLHVLGAGVNVAAGAEGTTVRLDIPDLALPDRPPADV
jgi:signal transduction histidine kinase